MTSFGMDYHGNMGGGFQGGGSYGGGNNYGAFGGGGYSYGGTNTVVVASVSQDEKPRRSYDEQTLIPITIGMALRARTDDGSEGSSSSGTHILEDGRVAHQVKVVAAVRSFENHSTNIMFSVEDGFNLIDVKVWLDDNDCSAVTELRQQAMQDHKYVKIVGQLKDYDGKRQIVANSIRRLNTGDELTHHFLEVVYSGEQFKRRGASAPPPVAAYPTAASRPLASQTGDGGLRDDVLNFIKREGEYVEAGANIGQCIARLCSGGRYTEHDIRRTVMTLVEEGHIYSTIDENNYKFAM